MGPKNPEAQNPSLFFLTWARGPSSLHNTNNIFISISFVELFDSGCNLDFGVMVQMPKVAIWIFVICPKLQFGFCHLMLSLHVATLFCICGHLSNLYFCFLWMFTLDVASSSGVYTNFQ
ncbi:hypothetical protein HanRHA438_Chr09g0396751 [Helianthus annuus]|nr:hypothetical protein HanIR_Chr09g0415451 [Helianthus annuus]KAJ0887959.1 hypothetical protein HanRHA438_Chr09g0396751 [Helianthus annuus]